LFVRLNGSAKPDSQVELLLATITTDDVDWKYRHGSVERHVRVLGISSTRRDSSQLN
jgi:hypothetical protein